MNHFVALIANASKSIEAESAEYVYVAIDECFNHKEIRKLAMRLLQSGFARGAGPLWNEKRQHADGSILYAMGGILRESKKHFSSIMGDIGKRSKYASTSDRQVLQLLVAHFSSYGKLILLTGNTLLDDDGLRLILGEEIRPAFEDIHDQRLSLLVFFKKGKTSVEQYASAVTAYLHQNTILPGYSEEFF